MQLIKTWIFYTKFIIRDGHQMVNTNILTLFHFGILYSTCYFQTYKVCLIITKKIRGKIQQKNALLYTYMHTYNFYSDLETKFDNIILCKTK
jgi:hypothetical protein